MTAPRQARQSQRLYPDLYCESDQCGVLCDDRGTICTRIFCHSRLESHCNVCYPSASHVSHYSYIIQKDQKSSRKHLL